MTLQIPDGGEVIALSYIVGKATPENLVLRLYQNDHTPADEDVVGDYDEADFTGYSGITLSGASWTVTPGDPTVAVYSEQDFTSSANQTPQTVYGYYLTRETGGELMWAERFPNPQIIQNNGDRISITARITAQDTDD